MSFIGGVGVGAAYACGKSTSAAASTSATGHVIEAFRDDLAPYEIKKGTIRFPLSQPVPVKLIERITKFLAKEAAERTRAKAARPKKRR